MLRFLLFLLLLAPFSAQAQDLANVVATCGTTNGTAYSATTNRPITQDTTGRVCDGGGGVIDGMGADATGTFTNATQTSSVSAGTIDNFGTVTVSINGTYNTASAVFEQSDDGGVTFYATQCGQIGAPVLETGYTGLTNTSRMWRCSVNGADTFRVRSTAVSSGTVNVVISVTAFPTSNGATVGALPSSSPAASAGIVPIVGGSAASSLVLKASAGNLYSVYAECSAACWLMVFNAVAAPSNGGTTAGVASGNLQECVAIPIGSNGAISYLPGPPSVFSVGITAVISSTTCATLTLATTGFIHGVIQ